MLEELDGARYHFDGRVDSEGGEGELQCLQRTRGAMIVAPHFVKPDVGGEKGLADGRFAARLTEDFELLEEQLDLAPIVFRPAVTDKQRVPEVQSDCLEHVSSLAEAD